METSPRPDPGYGIAPPGYRLPAGTHLGRVRLQVGDMERSLAFYTGKLGLQVLARDGAAASLGTGGGDEPLLELHERTGVRPVPRTGRLGLYHFAILLPNRAALGRFLAHLAAAGVAAGMADHLVSEALYLTDPDGLGIEVYADRPRAAWSHHGRDLAMDTRPLDVGDLLRAAGQAESGGAAGVDGAAGAAGAQASAAWRMPAGTRIGHVHLHVGDLPRAEAFYHAALGLDEVVRSYPGALFLSAGGYHHHLGVNTWAARAPAAGEEDARLLEWELVVPEPADVAAAADSLVAAGYDVARDEDGFRVADPWGTSLRVRVGRSGA